MTPLVLCGRTGRISTLFRVKVFQHVRPALEHLTVLGVFERVRDRRRRAYWVYRTVKNLEDVIQHK